MKKKRKYKEISGTISCRKCGKKMNLPISVTVPVDTIGYTCDRCQFIGDYTVAYIMDALPNEWLVLKLRSQ